MLPFYRSLVIHRDLYNVHGGFVGWTYEHLAIPVHQRALEQRPAPGPRRSCRAGPTLARAIGATDQADQLFAGDRLLFGASFVPWTRVKHPLYGDIEVGGFVKQSQAVRRRS